MSSIMRLRHLFLRFFTLCVLVAVLVQCDGPADTPPSPGGSSPGESAVKATAPLAQPKLYWTDELMHKEVKFYNPQYEGNGQFRIDNGEPVAIGLDGTKVSDLKFLLGRTGLVALYLSDTQVEDLGPLKGLPLVELYVERTRVKDLSPLRGMGLQKLYVSGAPVQDLGPLEGMPLTDFNAKDSPVSDLRPLRKSPLSMVWLTGCPVADIGPLKGLPMVSLTLHRTQVKDLSPLAGSGLQRLHIAETPVEDLTPLRGLRLTRLVFSPDRIKAGLDVARALPVREIGTKFEEDGNDLKPPGEFWVGR